MALHIGTTGYSYNYWGGENGRGFYKTKKANLQEYTAHFQSVALRARPSVEIGNTYYKRPTRKQCENWYKSTPAGFCFTIKAERRITHYRKLNPAVVKEWVPEFLKAIEPLKEKLGCIFFLCPPNFSCKLEHIQRIALLKSLIGSAEPTIKCAFEFRHDSWYLGKSQNPESMEAAELKRVFSGNFCMITVFNRVIKDHKLGNFGIGNHIYKGPSGDFQYYRLHGLEHFCIGTYGYDNMEKLAKTIQFEISQGKQVFVYFNNTDSWEPYNTQQVAKNPCLVVNELYPLAMYGIAMTTGYHIPSAIFDATVLQSFFSF